MNIPDESIESMLDRDRHRLLALSDELHIDARTDRMTAGCDVIERLGKANAESGIIQRAVEAALARAADTSSATLEQFARRVLRQASMAMALDDPAPLTNGLVEVLRVAKDAGCGGEAMQALTETLRDAAAEVVGAGLAHPFDTWLAPAADLLTAAAAYGDLKQGIHGEIRAEIRRRFPDAESRVMDLRTRIADQIERCVDAALISRLPGTERMMADFARKTIQDAARSPVAPELRLKVAALLTELVSLRADAWLTGSFRDELARICEFTRVADALAVRRDTLITRATNKLRARHNERLTGATAQKDAGEDLAILLELAAMTALPAARDEVVYRLAEFDKAAEMFSMPAEILSDASEILTEEIATLPEAEVAILITPGLEQIGRYLAVRGNLSTRGEEIASAVTGEFVRRHPELSGADDLLAPLMAADLLRLMTDLSFSTLDRGERRLAPRALGWIENQLSDFPSPATSIEALDLLIARTESALPQTAAGVLVPRIRAWRRLATVTAELRESAGEIIEAGVGAFRGDDSLSGRPDADAREEISDLLRSLLTESLLSAWLGMDEPLARTTRDTCERLLDRGKPVPALPLVLKAFSKALRSRLPRAGRDPLIATLQRVEQSLSVASDLSKSISAAAAEAVQTALNESPGLETAFPHARRRIWAAVRDLLRDAALSPVCERTSAEAFASGGLARWSLRTEASAVLNGTSAGAKVAVKSVDRALAPVIDGYVSRNISAAASLREIEEKASAMKAGRSAASPAEKVLVSELRPILIAAVVETLPEGARVRARMLGSVSARLIRAAGSAAKVQAAWETLVTLAGRELSQPVAKHVGPTLREIGEWLVMNAELSESAKRIIEECNRRLESKLGASGATSGVLARARQSSLRFLIACARETGEPSGNAALQAGEYAARLLEGRTDPELVRETLAVLQDSCRKHLKSGMARDLGNRIRKAGEAAGS